MSLPLPRPLGSPVCATCKGTKKVKLRDGTYVNCLPCSIPNPYNRNEDAPGADATGPVDALSKESTE